MPTYATPGVYVEEVPSGSMPLTAAGTAVAAFIGFTKKAPADDRFDENHPRSVTSWAQYERLYGGLTDDALLPLAVKGFFSNGGGKCYIVRIPDRTAVRKELPAADSDDGILEFVNITKDAVEVEITPIPPKPPAAGTTPNPDAPPKDPTFQITVTPNDGEPETFGPFGLGERGPSPVAVINNECESIDVLKIRDVVATKDKSNLAVAKQTITLDVPADASPDAEKFKGNSTERRGIEGLAIADDVTMVVVPDLWTVAKTGAMDDYGKDKYDADTWDGVQKAVLAHCQSERRMAILDSPPGLDVQGVSEWHENAGLDSAFATLYYPWLKVGKPSDVDGKKTIFVPPSGHMAGIWSRTDQTRGVWKAPANEGVLSVLDIQQGITSKEQEDLNPVGINAIRKFGTRGLKVWGARTLSSDPSWRYINVRRLFNMIETSIMNGTNWVVFEPNDHTLWERVSRTVNSFLLGLWRDGALFGTTPEEAFFVRCNAETNPPESIDEGKLIVEVGVAPVKPAEFVIFRLSQKAIGSAS